MEELTQNAGGKARKVPFAQADLLQPMDQIFPTVGWETALEIVARTVQGPDELGLVDHCDLCVLTEDGAHERRSRPGIAEDEEWNALALHLSSSGHGRGPARGRC